jgi:hypothetical protein
VAGPARRHAGQRAQSSGAAGLTIPKTGQEGGAVLMPAQQSGSPMTYSIDGRQYMIVAVSGGHFSGEYIAFALPQNEVRSTQQH